MKKGKKAEERTAAAIEWPTPEMVRLASIREADYNPRVMSPEMMASLKASLLRSGLVVVPVVQRRGMVLISGHQRLAALRELLDERGYAMPEEVPCYVLDVDDAAAKRLNVGLNRIGGDFDPAMLGSLFEGIGGGELADDALEAMGFTFDEVGGVIAQLRPDADDGDDGLGPGFARSVTLSIPFDTVEKRDAARARLREITEEKGGKAGEHLLRILRAHAAVHRAPSRSR